MIADDLFAGAGGWDLGAADLGIHARGVEIMPQARATRDAAGLATIHDDVWTFEPDGMARGLIASPPCQTFSAAGKGNGRKALNNVLAEIRSGAYRDLTWLRLLASEYGDDRTALVLTPLHFATAGDYEWLAWEQVPTVLPVWEACAEVLRREGWSVWTGRLHAEQYGVPQTRTRAFLLASRHHDVTAPTPTHSRYYSRTPEKLDPGVQKWVSMAEALGWGLSERPSPTVTGGGTDTGGAEPIAKWDRYTCRPDFIRMTTMPNSAVRHVDQPAPTIAFGHDAASCQWRWNEAVAERFTTPGTDAERAWPAARPAPTIVGSFHPEVVAAPGYRTDVSRQDQPHSVRITVEEAGILQTFPAIHPWEGSKGKQFLQCGNAVPPLLARVALRSAAGLVAGVAA